MPFCRKCGRRLPPYNEKCTDCGTSTTASLIKIKAPADNTFHASSKTRIAKAVILVAESPISIISSDKLAKETLPWKTATPAKPVAQTKKLPSTEEQFKHEIKQNNLSIEEDIITHPHDYETKTFDFDLKCRHEHFFPAGKALPISKGKAYCPECGEQLRTNKRKKRRGPYSF